MTDASALPFAVETPVEVVELLVSRVHRYEGRPADGPLAGGEAYELRDEIEVRAHLGIRGDRYFARPAHRTAGVTFQSLEALEALAADLGVPVPGLVQTRRNVLLRGVDVDALAGRTFTLAAGAEIAFQGHRPARPCGWMNTVIADGAHRAMRGRGGIRAEPLADGVLRVGPAVLRVE